MLPCTGGVTRLLRSLQPLRSHAGASPLSVCSRLHSLNALRPTAAAGARWMSSSVQEQSNSKSGHTGDGVSGQVQHQQPKAKVPFSTPKSHQDGIRISKAGRLLLRSLLPGEELELKKRASVLDPMMRSLVTQTLNQVNTNNQPSEWEDINPEEHASDEPVDFTGVRDKDELFKDRKQYYISKYGRNEHDSGDSLVQIAILTDRIENMRRHRRQARKDVASRRGLMKLLGQRRRMLKYLRRRDYNRYLLALREFNLRYLRQEDATYLDDPERYGVDVNPNQLV